MKTKEEYNAADQAKELTDCLASRGPRVDWVQTKKNVSKLWVKWIRQMADYDDYSPAALAMFHGEKCASSMKMLRKSARKFRAANKETA